VTAKAPSPTVGEKVDDAVVTTKVKAALLADPVVKSGDIGVVTREGEVQLSGFVDTQEQIDRATEVAKSAQGVKMVRNELSIKK
jgi:hyperosmotically inducible protein